MRVTLDTNVNVSALEFGGIGARLLGMASTGKIRLDVSTAILDELIGVLRDDFNWQGYRLHFAKSELARLGNLVAPTVTLAVTTDPDDNRILECAVASGSEFIVTKDKHLLRLVEYAGIRIETPGQFLEIAKER